MTASRNLFQHAYAEALSGADLVLVAAPFYINRVEPEQLLDRQLLAQALEQDGVASVMPAADGDPVATLVPRLCPGDVVVGCSSGDFGAFHRRLLEALGEYSVLHSST